MNRDQRSISSTWQCAVKAAVLLGIVCGFGSCEKMPQDNWTPLRAPQNLRLGLMVQDLCYFDGKLYLVSMESQEIYGVVGDSVVALWNEYGTDKPKFRAPNTIQHFGGRLVICDGQNLQLQIMDTSGTLIGSLPKRSLSDSLWWATETGRSSLDDFFVSEQYLGVFSSDTREGYTYGRMMVYESGTQEAMTFEDSFGPYGSVAFDEFSSTVFVEVRNVVLAYSVTGDLIGATSSMQNKDGIWFKAIADIVSMGGHLYVLDTQVGDDHNQNDSAAIYVLTPSLMPVDTIMFWDGPHRPAAFDFADDGAMIHIISLGGDALLTIENPVVRK